MRFARLRRTWHLPPRQLSEVSLSLPRIGVIRPKQKVRRNKWGIFDCLHGLPMPMGAVEVGDV